VRLFRIAQPKFNDPFNAEGSRIHGGRWNPKGTGILYYASTVSLAALEKRVHTPAAALGILWHLIEVDVPDALITTQPVAGLPANWRDHPPPGNVQNIGKQWVQSGVSLGLKVPSVVIPTEMNILLNPTHPDIGSAHAFPPVEFRFDERLAL